MNSRQPRAIRKRIWQTSLLTVIIASSGCGLLLARLGPFWTHLINQGEKSDSQSRAEEMEAIMELVESSTRDLSGAE